MRVLVLAPHTDDGELGLGATISKMLRNGDDVFYVAFSTCKESVPKGLDEDTLKKELLQSMNHFGVKSNNVFILDYKVRHFSDERQKILDDMIKLNREIKPDLVFIPSLNDIHQDHITIAKEGIRAFKKSSVLGYELPWNNLTFNNQTFSIVEKEDMDKKFECLSQYVSQKNRDYFQKEFIYGNCITHGIQVGVKYAEVFENYRWILK